MRIVLTGGIACGKSLLCSFLNGFGIRTLDADDIVHELIPDPAERRRIAAEVFRDPVARKALEARLHPLVKARLMDFVSAPRPPDEIRIAVVPLLFEVHWESGFDIICCVTSGEETQISRMVSHRGYSREEAVARLQAQMPVAEKAARSHYVIRNDGSSAELKEETRKFVQWLKKSMCSPIP